MNTLNFSNLTERLRTMNFAMDKISSIEHKGVLFPKIPEYVTRNYGKFSLAGEKLTDLATRQLFAWSTPRAESWVKMKGAKGGKIFTSNFYKCLQLNLTKKQQRLSFPKDFEKVISQMRKIITNYSEEQKEYRKTHKKEIAAETQERKDFGTAVVDGVEYKYSPMVEAGGIFYGRGDNRYDGGWALDVMPEDVSLNSSKNIPCPIKGHHWKDCSLKPNSFSPYSFDKWILIGTEKIHIVKRGEFAKSPIKEQNDVHKFDKAKSIDLIMPKIIRSVKKMVTSEKYRDKQIGCCAYLITKFGIRAGNVTDKRQNGVRGASTLLNGDIELLSANKLHLTFKGKDSIQYDNTLKIDSYAYQAFEELKDKCESDNERIFPNITSNSVNVFFKNIDKNTPDLTCKNFRTFFGTSALTREIQKHEDEWSSDMSDKEFKNLYDNCVFEVAKILNHKKTVSKEQSDKTEASVKEKLKAIKKALKTTLDRSNLKIAKLEEENKKLNKTKPKGYKELIKQNSELISELEYANEDAERTYAAKRAEQLSRIEKQDVALNTSKGNYSSPKIAYSLCKYCGKEPKLILSPTLVDRFNSWVDMDSISETYWKDYPNVED